MDKQFTIFKITKEFVDNIRAKREGAHFHDFEELIIVDPIASTLTKKDFFKEIMFRHNLTPDEVLVVGDDLHSEIKAAKELGIATVLYDYLDENKTLAGENVINNYRQLEKYLWNNSGF